MVHLSFNSCFNCLSRLDERMSESQTTTTEMSMSVVSGAQTANHEQKDRESYKESESIKTICTMICKNIFSNRNLWQVVLLWIFLIMALIVPQCYYKINSSNWNYYWVLCLPFIKWVVYYVYLTTHFRTLCFFSNICMQDIYSVILGLDNNFIYQYSDTMCIGWIKWLLKASFLHDIVNLGLYLVALCNTKHFEFIWAIDAANINHEKSTARANGYILYLGVCGIYVLQLIVFSGICGIGAWPNPKIKRNINNNNNNKFINNNNEINQSIIIISKTPVEKFGSLNRDLHTHIHNNNMNNNNQDMYMYESENEYQQNDDPYCLIRYVFIYLFALIAYVVMLFTIVDDEFGLDNINWFVWLMFCYYVLSWSVYCFAIAFLASAFSSSFKNAINQINVFYQQNSSFNSIRECQQFWDKRQQLVTVTIPQRVHYAMIAVSIIICGLLAVIIFLGYLWWVDWLDVSSIALYVCGFGKFCTSFLFFPS